MFWFHYTLHHRIKSLVRTLTGMGSWREQVDMTPQPHAVWTDGGQVLSTPWSL